MWVATVPRLHRSVETRTRVGTVVRFTNRLTSRSQIDREKKIIDGKGVECYPSIFKYCANLIVIHRRDASPMIQCKEDDDSDGVIRLFIRRVCNFWFRIWRAQFSITRMNLPVIGLKLDVVTTHICLSLAAVRCKKTSTNFTNCIDLTQNK